MPSKSSTEYLKKQAMANEKLERAICSCIEASLQPDISDWAKKFWKETANKLQKKVDK